MLRMYYATKRIRRNSFPLTSKENNLIKNLNSASLQRKHTRKVEDHVVR